MSVINKIGQLVKEPVEDKYIFFAGSFIMPKICMEGDIYTWLILLNL